MADKTRKPHRAVVWLPSNRRNTISNRMVDFMIAQMFCTVNNYPGGAAWMI